MQSFEALSRELERLGKTEKLRALADSAAGRELAASPDAGALAAAAERGDAAAVRRLLGGLLGTAEGRRLMEDVRRLMEQ